MSEEVSRMQIIPDCEQQLTASIVNRSSNPYSSRVSHQFPCPNSEFKQVRYDPNVPPLVTYSRPTWRRHGEQWGHRGWSIILSLIFFVSYVWGRCYCRLQLIKFPARRCSKSGIHYADIGESLLYIRERYWGLHLESAAATYEWNILSSDGSGTSWQWSAFGTTTLPTFYVTMISTIYWLQTTQLCQLV